MKAFLFGTIFRFFLILFGTGCCCNSISAKNEKNKEKLVFPDYGEVLAFPGAEGYGRFATGARGGKIYRVTNLNDSGEGSLRDAVSQPNRFVIFDVEGVIHLESVLTFADNITVSGQTAPGDGIVIYGNPVSFSGSKNLIIRYLRIRMGKNGIEGKDAAEVTSGSNMIFDHLSVTWGSNNTFSISGNNSNIHDITIQNSIIGQGLQPQSSGSLLQTTEEQGITLYRNLYIDNEAHNPKVKGLNQYVNNVVYNWGSGGCYIMGDSNHKSIAHIENNYFITGACKNYNGKTYHPAKVFTRYNKNFHVYLAGNYFDANKDGVLNGQLITKKNCSSAELTDDGEDIIFAPTFLNSPSPEHPKITHLMSAEEAYYWIVKDVGASLPVRDQVDTYLIDELISLGKKGQLINDESMLGLENKVGILKTGVKPLDSDGDGIPDEFEDKYGLDKNNPSDATYIAHNGYSNIENYIFSLSEKRQ